MTLQFYFESAHLHKKPLLSNLRGGFLILYPKSYPKKVDVIPQKNHLESNDPKLFWFFRNLVEA